MMKPSYLVLLAVACAGQVLPPVCRAEAGDIPAPPPGALHARDAVAPPDLVDDQGNLTLTGFRSSELSGPLSGNPLPDFAADPDVAARKEHFFGYLLPLVRAENRRISRIRERLDYIREYFRWGRGLTVGDENWLALVVAEYLVPDFDPARTAAWEDLLRRVDTLPPKLVLVQAANESAWGTSRFAREGNNLFGQWCFGEGCGMVPRGRPFGATYEVARYESVRESVGSYMHNLNTGRAYRLFREIRAAARRDGQVPEAGVLAPGLRYYSSRGQDYIDELRAMMRHNADIIERLSTPQASDGKS